MMKLFLNPFEKYSEKIFIPLGLSVLLLGSFLASFCSANFDGLLDLHFSASSVSFFEIVYQNVVNLIIIGALLYLAGYLVNPKIRAIDIVSTVLVARIPFYFLALFNISKKFSFKEDATLQEINAFAIDNIFLLLGFGLLVLLIVIWMVALLYNGFKVATNAKGSKPVVLFILAIVLSEILTKLIFYPF
ncbi:MAG: hypothetical protein WC044_04220 [Crocinitomicaceae bacterium]